MNHLFLAHLSRDNNSPHLVSELFTKHAGNTRIIVASRYTETAVHVISNEQTRKSGIDLFSKKSPQLSLF